VLRIDDAKEIAQLIYVKRELVKTLPRELVLEGEGAAIHPVASVECLRVSSAPFEKHDLRECAKYEERWRKSVTCIVRSMTSQAQCAVVWAYGRFESDGLLRLLGHVDDWNDAGLLYELPSIRHSRGPGYCGAWVAVEFEPTSFSLIVKDESLDLEEIRLRVITSNVGDIEELLRPPFPGVSGDWIATDKGCAIIMSSHFEGCDIITAMNSGARLEKLINEVSAEQLDVEDA